MRLIVIYFFVHVTLFKLEDISEISKYLFFPFKVWNIGAMQRTGGSRIRCSTTRQRKCDSSSLGSDKQQTGAG